MKHAYLLYTGYGKTKLMLDKIMACPLKPRVLLLSTKKIVESSWQGEIDKWYPGKLTYQYITGSIPVKQRLELIQKPVDILALNTEMLQWYIEHTTNIKKTVHRKSGVKNFYNTDELVQRFNMIIIDESTLFKNYRSNRFKVLKSWCSKVEDVYILSATPTPKNIEEELNDLLTNYKKQRQLLEDYEDLRCKLGNAGASNNAATIIVNDLNKKDK